MGLTKTFKKELQKFQRLSVDVDKKCRQYTPVEQTQPTNSSTPLLYNDDGGGYGNQEEDMQITITEYDVATMEKREEKMHQIESDVQEINEMFMDLNELVMEQQEQIDTIEENVIQVRDNTEQAVSEVTKAQEYQKKKRKKMCYLLGFLVL